MYGAYDVKDDTYDCKVNTYDATDGAYGRNGDAYDRKVEHTTDFRGFPVCTRMVHTMEKTMHTM